MFKYKFIKETTAQHRDINQPSETRISAKNKAIIAAVNAGNWGCQDSSVRALVSAIVGVDIPIVDKNKIPEKNTLIFFDDEFLIIIGHDCDGDALFVNADFEKETSNNGYSYIVNTYDWRYATDEEIDKFFGFDS